MGVWSYVKSLLIVHLLLGYIFVASGLIISFLMLTSCLIYPFHKHLYRKINNNLAYSHWCQLTFLGQWWAGSECKVHATEEDIKMLGKEHVLAVMNHKFDIDWLMAWIVAERMGMLGGTKIYGKNMLKYVPLIGWAWYFTESIFLKRKWEDDKVTMKKDLMKMADYPDNYWITLLLFPEGTRFTEEKHKSSLEVTRQKGYKEMKHHLLPRPKGFNLSMHGLRDSIPTILELTCAFDKNYPEPTLMNVLQGKALFGRINARRISLKSVPVEPEACATWLRNLFYEKDDIYEYFVQHNTFEASEHTIPRRINDFVVFLFWALVTCIPMFSYLANLFLSGSLTQQAVFLVFVTLATVGIRWMIGVTEIKKGSSYGKKES